MQTRRVSRVVAAVVVSVMGFSAAAFPGPAAAAEAVRINGSGIALDMMRSLVEAYARSRPAVRFEIDKPLGSSGAIKALLAGALDLVVSSKRLTAEQVQQGAKSREYGETPLAIVVERNVAKSGITTGELEQIYAGTLNVWPDGERIRVVLRPDTDVDTMILKGLSPALGRAIDAARSHPGMLMAVTDPESNEAIARTPGAIGASGLPGLLVGKAPLKILPLNGVAPTVAALAGRTYPLAKEIRFVTKGAAPAAVEELIAFAYSAAGRALAEQAGVRVVAGEPAGR